MASQEGHIEVVRGLLAKGAQIDIQCNTGASALFIAIASQEGHIADVPVLLCLSIRATVAKSSLDYFNMSFLTSHD